jgi:Phage integrase family
MAGVNLKAVQEILGHRTIAMTMRYSHLKPNHLASEMKKIASGAVATEVATGLQIDLPINGTIARKFKKTK